MSGALRTIAGPRKTCVRLIATAAMLIMSAAPGMAVTVITDGDMETNPIGNWTHTDITGANSSSADPGGGQGGSQALLITSATGNILPRGWYDRQTTNQQINAADAVTLSLWYAYNWAKDPNTGTLYVDIQTTGGGWASPTTIWSQALSPAASDTTYTGSASGVDVSGFFTADATYDVRLRFEGTTGNHNAGRINIWWDDVVLDKVGAVCTHNPPTVAVLTGDQSVTCGSSVNYTIRITNNDSGCSGHIFDLAYADSNGANFTTSGPATSGNIADGAFADIAMNVAAGANARGQTNASTITVSEATDHNPGVSNNTADTTGDTTAPNNAAWGASTVGNGLVDLVWSDPGDADFVEIIIVRRQTDNAFTGAPADGTTYTTAGNIGGDAIVFVGSGGAYTDNTVVNENNYYYKTYARDDCVNWSTGSVTGPLFPTAITPDALQTSSPTAIETVNPTQGDEGVVMMRFQLGSDAAGDDSMVLESLTMQDNGSATTADVEIVHVYIDTTTTWGTATEIGMALFTADPLTIPLDLGTVGDRTVTSAQAKYIWVVYDIDWGATGGRTIQAEVTDVAVISPDNGVTGLAGYTSNTLTIQTSGGTSTATIPPSGEGSASAWTYGLGAGNGGDWNNLVTNDGDSTHVYAGAKNINHLVTVDTSGQSGTISDVRVHAVCRRVAGNENIAFLLNGTATISGTVTLSGDTTYTEYSVSFGSGYTWVGLTEVGLRSVGSGGWGGDIRCTQVWLEVDYSGGAAPSPDDLAASVNTPTTASNPAPGATGLVMQRIQLDSDGLGSDGAVRLTSLTMQDNGTATIADIETVHVYMDTSSTWGTATLVGSASFTSDPLTITLNQGVNADRTVTNPTTKYLWIVYDVASGATDGRTLISEITDIVVKSPDTGESGLGGFVSNTHTVSVSSDTTTLDDGGNPAATPQLCPGDGLTWIDSFTFITSGNSDGVTALTVTLTPAGAFDNIARVEVTEDSASPGTIYGFNNALASDTVAITLSGLTATGGSTQYRVRIQPKTHAAMPIPAIGASFDVQATVTAFTTQANATAGSDAASDTVTVDNASATVATTPTCTPDSSSQITVGWDALPGDAAGVVIFRGPDGGACPTVSPAEGDTFIVGQIDASNWVSYIGAGTSAAISGLTQNTSYCFEIWTYDGCDNFSATLATTACTTLDVVADDTTVGIPTGFADGCNQITVSASFTGDGNTNGSTKFEWGPTITGPWSDVTGCLAVVGASPRQCVDATVSANTNYYYQVTFTDGDGVIGTNPQVASATLTPYCNPDITIGNNSAAGTSCDQATVTMYFSGDDNGDSSTLVEFRKGADAFATACGAISGPSPRQCLVTGLVNNTSYDFRITYTDGDGINGTNGEVVVASTFATCAGDTVPPTVTILTPERDAIIGGAEVFKVQVYDASASIGTLEWSANEGAIGPTSFIGTINGNYNCGTPECKIYEFTLDTVALGLTNGANTVVVRTVDGAGNVSLLNWTVNVNNTGGKSAGIGTLLRRTHGSQICMDCHNIPSHSSQHTSTKYGSWSVNCLTCHTPHNTTNIKLIREQIQTPNSGTMNVLLHKDQAANLGTVVGEYSFLGDVSGASNTPYNDGVCEVCHTRTTHYRNDASGGDHNHAETKNCSDCHKHSTGFAGACDQCHVSPPTVGKHGIHDEIGAVPNLYEPVASDATESQYSFPCAKCHTGTHLNDGNTGTAGDPYQVEVAFDTTAAPDNTGGTFQQVLFPSAEVSIDQGNDTSLYWAWTSGVTGANGSCDNLYCHSNGAALGVGSQFQSPPPQWNQAGGLGCSSCHPAANKSSSHTKHVNTYSFGCVRCHTNVADTNSSIRSDVVGGGKILHVNGQPNVDLDNSGVDNSSGFYRSTLTAPNYSCNNTYCHSDGTLAGPPWASGDSIAWNTSAAADCTSCHNGAVGAASVMATNKHGNHVNNLTSGGGVLGVNYGCVDCHNATVSNNTTVNNTSNHVNGSPTVSLASGSWNGTQCSNAYCHSSGEATPEFYNVIWATDSLDCKGCHGRHSDNAFVSASGEPNHNNAGAGLAGANSHQKHLSDNLLCADCHFGTTTTGTDIKDGSTIHTDGSIDSQMSATFGGTYDGTVTVKTCSSVSCHPSQTPQWGAANPWTCRSCHMDATGTAGVNGDVEDFTFRNGTLAMIDGDDWVAYGHGNDAGFDESNNGSPDFDKVTLGCVFCHDSAVNHGDTANPFRLMNVGGADGKNGVCLICHKNNSSPGVDIGADAITSSLYVGTSHYGFAHRDTAGVGTNPAAGAGGEFCWDCHDPHGDYNYTDNQLLAYMIQERPTRDHVTGLNGGWGQPTDLAPAPDFRSTRDGSGQTDFDWGDFVVDTESGGFYRGLCQVCHTVNSRYRQSAALKPWDVLDEGDHFPTAGTCTTAGCHLHNNNFVQKGCNECHQAAPRPGSPLPYDDEHGIHFEIGDASITGGATTIPRTYTELTVRATKDFYGFPCAKCHSSDAGAAGPAGPTAHFSDLTHTGDPGDSYEVDVAFDTSTLPDNTGGTYAGKTYPQNEDSDNADVDGHVWNWSTMTCSGLYCHSNAAPVGGTDSRAAGIPWQNTGSLTCTGCHNTSGSDQGGAVTDLSQKHGKHINNTATSYAFRCDECHVATMADGYTDPLDRADIVDKRQHVDGEKDVLFSSTFTAGNIDQSGGSYAASTCSSTYCHSQGGATTAPFGGAPNSDPNWNTGTTTCTTCHDGPATMATGAHAAHVEQSTYLGTDFGCVRCHQDTVSNDTTINTYSFHVNGSRDVNMSNGGTWTDPNCSSTYCHSDGTETLGYSAGINWDSGSLTNDCAVCHGTAVRWGAPDYANGYPVVDLSNSHAVGGHVSSATDCVKCHDATTDGTIDGGGFPTLTGSGHLNGTRDVSNTTYIGGYDEATETCSNISCHGNNSAVWGASLSCADCHVEASPGDNNYTSDSDDYTWSGGTGAATLVDRDEWEDFGHGRPSGSYTESGNNPGNFDTGGQDGCLYCHNPVVDHNDSNFFRLRNVGAASTAIEKNGVCTICHATGNPAYGSGIGLADKNPTARVGASHYGAAHPGQGGSGTNASDGGVFCWDCHDPHGDYNDTALQNLAYMIQRDPVEDHSGASGWGIPTLTATTPDFRANRDGVAAWDWPDYVVPAAAYNGVCQVCHQETVRFLKASEPDPKYDAGHYNSSGRCSTGGCHEHDQPDYDAFKPAGGGNCLGCHSNGASGTYSRRDVDEEFGLWSHHVGADGYDPGTGAWTQSNMGGNLTNFDCVVCHAEGYASWNATDSIWETVTSTLYHGNDGGQTSIDLRDADGSKIDTEPAASEVYSFHGKDIEDPITVGNWNSSTQSWREWTSGVDEGGGADLSAGAAWRKGGITTKVGLDPFCLSCHDSDGASQANVGTVTSGTGNPDDPYGTAGAGNPFGDLAITNEYDLTNRNIAPAPNGLSTGLVDIRAMVDSSWDDVTKSVITPIDRDQAGDDRFDEAPAGSQGIADPPQGIFARHAIRGASDSVYSSTHGTWDSNTFWTDSTQWNSTSVMSCADCHTSDGANANSGSAHGSQTEYLLKDDTGGATAAFSGGSTTVNSGYVCWNCHSSSLYYELQHTPNANEFQDSYGQIGVAARLDGEGKGGTLFGLSCLNCHGGYGFGNLHGTSQVLKIGPTDMSGLQTGGDRQNYRFTNGGSLRYLDPDDVEDGDARPWDGSNATCYTLTDPDGQWGGCKQHGGGTGRARSVTRSLKY